MFVLAVTAKYFVTVEILGIYNLKDLSRALARAGTRPNADVQIDLVEIQ
jgi:hypothetical protein